jgi:hypothetical protein
MTSQNEFYYKAELKKAISKWLQKITSDDNDLGYIPDEIEDNMTEAAWLIMKANKDCNNYFEKEVITL